MTAPAGTAGLFLRVTGVVQGVGFRPFVHRIATRCGLSGVVTNAPGSVAIRVEGTKDALEAFRRLLRAEAPAAARIARITARPVAPSGLRGFSIGASDREGMPLSTIPPDIATCAACRAEFLDPADRRHLYPFVNCTNCGPRFTIVTRLPYDRPNTSMSAFSMCPECLREYRDPADRRFHAEPNACPACGPRLSIAGPDGTRVPAGDPVGHAAAALREGKIVAIRGLGGFQLAADATREDAVAALRARKFREEKPFAVMVADAAAARRIARLSPADEAILSSPAAPILLLPAAAGSPLAPAVAPGLATVGIFFPYTPLHRLLLDRAGAPLVMTSGNRSDEPIAIANDEAVARLRGIADLFLLHDREIVQRTDDSVVRRVGRRAYPVRRARGFVPAPVLLRRAAPACVAGLGAELKATFCIAKGRFAWLSQHIGDLDQAPARDFYRETFAFFRTFLGARLDAVCRDLHPGYFTSGFAEEAGAGRIVSLQHHRAHLYALIAESGFRGKAVGVSFDGTGYGEDGAVWGGEIFAIDGMEMERAASLRYFPLQGGDSAVRAPWKSALGFLVETLGARGAAEAARALFPEIPENAAALVLDAIAKGVNTVPSSSCGRLFDAVAALAGACRRATFEGQAPMLLTERAGRRADRAAYPCPVRDESGRLEIDWRDLIAGIVEDLRANVPVPVVARRFHEALAGAVVEACAILSRRSGARRVLLSGGVFQNMLLLRLVRAGLARRGLGVLVHRRVPCNDGGISLGQAAYAAHILSGGR